MFYNIAICLSLIFTVAVITYHVTVAMLKTQTKEAIQKAEMNAWDLAWNAGWNSRSLDLKPYLDLEQYEKTRGVPFQTRM